MLVLPGCVVVSRESARPGGSSTFSPSPQDQSPAKAQSEAPTQGKGLIKPYIPEDTGPKPGEITDTKPEAVPVVQPGLDQSVSKEADRLPKWEEDQKVRVAALKKAEEYPNVKKIKICLSVQDDEWWIIFYNDIGTAIDLKQFVWDRKTEALEPHLVIKQIPRSQLESHLTRKQPGRGCEVLDPPAPKVR
jgi:hypothetical protein